MSFAVIFGATGGIGAALVDAAERSGEFNTVLGLSRHSTPALDLCDEQTIREAAAHVGILGAPSLVIVTTGVLHRPEKTCPATNVRSSPCCPQRSAASATTGWGVGIPIGLPRRR